MEENFAQNNSDFISLAEASKVTGYTQDYLGFLSRTGKLKAFKIGRNWVTSKKSLQNFIANHKNGLSEIIDDTGAKIKIRTIDNEPKQEQSSDIPKVSLAKLGLLKKEVLEGIESRIKEADINLGQIESTIQKLINQVKGGFSQTLRGQSQEKENQFVVSSHLQSQAQRNLHEHFTSTLPAVESGIRSTEILRQEPEVKEFYNFFSKDNLKRLKDSFNFYPPQVFKKIFAGAGSIIILVFLISLTWTYFLNESKDPKFAETRIIYQKPNLGISIAPLQQDEKKGRDEQSGSAVVTERLVTQNIVKNLPPDVSLLTQLIDNRLNVYLTEGKFKGEKGDKGDPGQLGNLITYIQPASNSGTTPGSIAGFTHLSAVDFFSDNITAGSAFTANGTATFGGSAVFSSNATFSALVTLGATSTLNGVTYIWPSAQGSVNQALQNDGFGNLSWATMSGGGAGTGTVASGLAGAFAYYPLSGQTVDDQTVLYLSDGKIGIGTSVPDSSLHVQGSSSVNTILTISSSSGNSLLLIDASGNLGIGTTTPQSKLTIVGDGYFGGGLSISGSTTISTLTSGVVKSSASGSLYVGPVTNSDLQNASVTINAGAGLTGGGAVALGGSVGLSLAATGTPGTYGSVSQVPVFTVNSYGQIISATSSNIAIDTSQITAGTLGYSRGGTGQISYTTNGIIYAGSSAFQSTSAGTPFQVLRSNGFGTGPSYSDIADLLTAGTNVNVSGTSTIAVVDTPSFSTLTVIATSTLATASIASLLLNQPLAISYGGTGAVTKTAAFDALSPLTTKGDLIVHDGTNNIRFTVGTNGLCLTASSTTTSGLAWSACASGGSGTPGGTDTQIQFNDSGAFGGSANLVWLNSTQRLGVNTSSPISTVTVQGVGGVNPFTIASSTGVSLVTVTQTGNVGIGTTTPAERLEVVGNIKVAGNIMPEMTGATGAISVRTLGDINNRFADVWAEEVHVGASSLYVNGKKVISDVSNVMNFTTDIDQSLIVKTAGTGNLNLQTGLGTLFLNGDNQISLNGKGGIDLNVPVDTPSKNLNLNNYSLNGNITLTTAGANSQILASAVQKAAITAPTIELNGNVTASGTMNVGIINSGTWNGSPISVAYGGTGANLLTQYALLAGNGTNAVATISPGTVYQVLRSAGSSAVPAYSDISSLLTAGSNIQITGTSTISVIGIGSTIQGWNANLDTLAGLSNTKGNLIVGNGSVWTTQAVASDGLCLTASSTTTSGLAWSACASGGSGTPGGTDTQIQFNDSGAFGGSANLVWLNSTQRLGVNTSSPISTVTVQGVGGVNPFTIASSTGVSLVTVTQTGNVGIGTTTPSEKLEIAGAMKMGSVRLIQDPGDAFRLMLQPTIIDNSLNFSLSRNGTEGAMGFQLFRTDFYADRNNSESLRLLARGDAGDPVHRYEIKVNAAGTGSLRSLVFVQGSTDVMTIATSSNVGIGTTNPGAKLHVAGTVGIFGASNNYGYFTVHGNPGIDLISGTAPAIGGDLNIGVNSAWRQTISSNWYYGGTPSADRYARTGGAAQIALTTQTLSGYEAGDIDFLTAPVGDAGNQITFSRRLTIKQNGNVGIGTTSPAAKLNIHGYRGGTVGSAVAALSKNLIVGGEYNVASITQNAVGLLIADYDNDAGSNYYPIYVEDENNVVSFFLKAGEASDAGKAYFGGNVGIGTSTVSSRLVVQGSGSNILSLLDGAGSEKVTVLNNGNVGIGTTSPSALLHVQTTGTLPLLVQRYGGDAAITLQGYDTIVRFLDNTGGTAKWTIGKDNTDNSFRISSDTDTPGANDRLIITSGGNVGIGTTSPGALLDVGGGKLMVTSGGTVGLGAAPNVAVGLDIKQAITANSGFAIQQWLRSTLTASADNDLLIGLDVGGTVAKGTYTGLDVRNIFVTDNVVTGTGTVNNHYSIYIAQPTLGIKNYALYSAGGTNYFGGNVGIGTASPASLLHVAGAIRAGVASATAGTLILQNASNGYTLTLQASSSQTSNITLILPPTSGTSGQALLTDGSGTAYWGTVSGSGTPGGTDTQIQFNNSGAFGGSANLVWLNSTQRLGVNTSSPISTVTVQGVGGVNPFTIASSTGVSLVTVTQTGNVGIGTTTPSAKLTVAVAEDAAALAVVDTTNNDSIAIYTGTSSPESRIPANIGSLFVDHASGRIYKKSNDNGLATGWTELLSTASSTHMAQMTRTTTQSIPHGTNTKIAFDSEVFDVGGIADPVTNSRFDIKRTGKYLIEATWTAPNMDPNEDAWIFIYKNGAVIAQTISSNGPGTNVNIPLHVSSVVELQIGDYLEMIVSHWEGGSQNTLTNEADKPRMSVVELTPTGGGGSLFTDGGATTYLTETTDRLAIGTTSADSTFYIQGGGNVNPFTIASSTGVSLVTVTQTGNVGIGTTTPLERLTVSGSASVANIGLLDVNGSAVKTQFSNRNGLSLWDTNLSINDIKQTNARSAWRVFVGDDSGSFNRFGIQTDARGNGTWGSGFSEVFSILNTGSIGIGTNNPTQKLEIASGSVMVTSSQPTLFFMENDETNKSWKIVGSGGNFYLQAINDSLGMLSTPLFVGNSGNIGIGTTSPGSSRLYVRHDQNSTSNVVFSNLDTTDTNSRFLLQLNAGNVSGIFRVIHNDNVYFGAGTNHGLALQTNTLNRIYITNTGEVGINTTSPQTRLSVVGSGSQDPFSVASSSGTSFLRVTQAGNVGIGTTTPFAKLSVLGSTTSSGADAVAGIFTETTLTNSTLNGFQFGGRMLNTINGSATGTSVGLFLRMTDNTTLGNTVRGLEVQAYSGTNTAGVNTGILAFGKTFGIQGVTDALAGGVSVPAAVFADLDNGSASSTGNAIRAYSDNAEGADLVSFYQETSAFSGNGLIMNFGNNSGSFTGNFINLQKAGAVKLKVDHLGRTSIGTGTIGSMLDVASSTSASDIDIFRILTNVGGAANVKARIDSDGDLFLDGAITAASTTITSGSADIAEEYNVMDDAVAGDVVVPAGGANVVKATSTAAARVLGIISTDPGLTLSLKDRNNSLTVLNPKPVALAGRVPIKVTNENGPVEAGDYLTVSKEFPGYAMKATYSGYIVGQALEAFVGDSTVSNDSPSGGKIMAFVKSGYKVINNVFVLEDSQVTGSVGNGVPTSSKETTFLINQKGSGNLLQLQRDGMDKFVVDNGGNLTLFVSAVASAFPLKVVTASATVFSISPKGDLYAKGKITVGKDTAGTAIIKAGDNQTTVTFEIPYPSIPKITVSANGVPNFFYGVVDKSVDGFTIRTDKPVEQEFSFDWVALLQPEETPSRSGINLQVISSPTAGSGSAAVLETIPNAPQTPPQVSTSTGISSGVGPNLNSANNMVEPRLQDSASNEPTPTEPVLNPPATAPADQVNPLAITE